MNSSDEIYQDKEDLDHNRDEVVQNHMKSQIAEKVHEHMNGKFTTTTRRFTLRSESPHVQTK